MQPSCFYTTRMLVLSQIEDYCNKRLNVSAIEDFPGILNGLQVENSGKVTKIGAGVDASLWTFNAAKQQNVDFLIVHHGLFKGGWTHLCGPHYQRMRRLFEGDCALYASHLPLDAHPQLGNNAQLAAALGLEPIDSFLNYKGTDIGIITEAPPSRDALKLQLETLFERPILSLEWGSLTPLRVGFCSGNGSSALTQLIASGVDTLVTGELKQSCFAQIQEAGLNVYACGHYATETFGVKALAQDLAQRFDLPWSFLDSFCPL